MVVTAAITGHCSYRRNQRGVDCLPTRLPCRRVYFASAMARATRDAPAGRAIACRPTRISVVADGRQQRGCLQSFVVAISASRILIFKGKSKMNKDQVEGRVDQAKGKAKEVAGRIVGNDKLQAEGLGEQAKGKVQSVFGNAREDAKDAAKKLINKI